MSALPCITNSRPGVPIFALSGQGGGGIPANPDLTLSTLTVAQTAVVSTLGAGGGSLALLSKATEGGVRILGDNGTDATTLTVANINVSSIAGASGLTISPGPLFVNDAIYINPPGAEINFVGNDGNIGGVSTINGVPYPPGGAPSLSASSIGLVAPFNTGPSTTVIVQEPASPSPPTQFTTLFDLEADTIYNLAANLNYQFSNSITNSNVYMGMRLTNAPANVVFSPPDYQIGYGNLQGWTPSWNFTTGSSTISGVQMDLLLNFENNANNVSSFIYPPYPNGYSVVLTKLGVRPE